MKNLFKSFVVGALLLGSVGCSDMFKEDLYEINNEIDKINQRIDSLCNAVNTNIASLQTIIDVMQDNDYVDSITPIVEGGETVGYEIVFTQSGSVKIYHGKKGETGATGHTPVIGVKQAEDGRWYWTVDGAYLLDGEGDKILAEAIDGEDGATGADGITPQLKVEGDYWYISYDNKATWERLGKATGEAGKDGDSMFQSVNYNDEYVELVLIDGTVLRIPTWASHMLLVDEIAKINSNISAIQAAIEALESNDYVQKVTPVKDEDGNVIGYTLQFAFTGDVTIYHGEDGKDGEDGEDGKDGEDGEDGKDGYTPVIGARQHPDGNWYWTVDTEWLLDTNGNKVKTTGEDGTSGITPELKIEDDYWYVSYDKGQTWTKLGKAKGEDGAAGSAGTAGDAFFKGVDTSDEYYVKFTLADGSVIKIPTWKAYQELADLVDQLNTNFKSLNDIVVGIQNNDYITGYTPIVDPQTNEEIGYTLHFAKSGDITIYHGKTGQDGVAPDISIQEHPKYGLCWTYNGEFIIDPGTGKPVALPSDGKNGKDGVSPKLKIEDGEWWVSYNNGSSWTSLGQATGDTGATGGTGDSFFKSIEPEYAKDANGNVLKDELGRPIVAYIVMTLAGENEGDEVTYKVPTEYVTSELNKRIAALETQFTAIETIVKAIQNAEYIKSVVEQYDGPALVGYKITFIKYTIENGTLIPSERDVYIGSASNAGSKVEYAKDENGDYYWVIDGSPLKDEDGNILYIEGKTPTVEINKDGYWVINGVNTGVKAEGKDGANGSNGSNASSLFSDVVLDGSYYVFTFTDGRDPIKVPSWKAFEDLQKAVTQLTATVESFTELIQGNKYIEKVEALSENKGYTLFVKEFNADTQTWDTKSYTIYNGTDGSNGTTPVVPTISVAQDPENPEDQNYYWKVGDNWLTDAQGNKIRANALDGDPGLDALTPEFRIVNGTLYYKYTNEGDDKWRELANVQGSSAAVNIIFQNPANPLESEWIEIRFGEGENDKIKIPTWVAYEKIQDTISSLTTNVEAISALVYGHKYVESFKELENGGYEFVVRYYDEAAKEWKTEVHTIDITTADEIGVKQDTDGNYYWTKGGEWLLDAAGNKVMVDGSAERILEFDSKNDGKLYYKYSDETEWTVLDIAVSESVVDSNVVVKEEDGKVTVTVLDDAGMILYTFSAPSWEAFEALQGRVIALEEQVTDINDLIDQLTNNYQALSGDVKNMKDKLAKCKFIGKYEYDEERKGHVIYLVDIDGNKLQDAAGDFETIFIADGEDGEDGEDFDASMLSFTEVDGEYFWTYNGEMLVDAAGKPVKAHGADGRTPEFGLIDDELVYRYEGDEEWISLGNVKGSAAAANITVDPSDVPMWIEIEYSYVDEEGKESVSKIKVPTYHAYEMAVQEIAAIQSNIDLVEEFLNKGKFVADYKLEYDENGMIIGCTMTTVEYKLQEDGSYRVFTSPAEFKPSQTMHLEVDENEGVWYLVGYKKGEDGKIEEVRRPLSQSAFTFVPKIAVDKGYIYLAKVSVPGTDYTDTQKWECLGAVVELLGGETGSAQGALKSVEEIDGYICFTFSNGDVLKVPSDAKFQEVLDRLDAVEADVEAIQGSITTINGSLESLSAKISALESAQSNYLTSAEFQTWKDRARFVQSVTKEGDVWSFDVADGNGNVIAEAGFDITATHHVSTYEKDGDLYWVINGKETDYPVETKPHFQVDGSGRLMFTFDDPKSATAEWTTLESASNAVKVVFTDNPYPAEGKWVAADAATALWAGIFYSEENIIWMPTYLNFKNIEGRLAKVEGDVVAIQGSIATINGSLASLSEQIAALEGVQGNYLTSAEFQEWKDGARFVQNVTKNGDVWSFVVADGNGKAIEGAGFDITATHHVSTYEKDGVLYWVINDVKTEYPVESKPKFRVTDSGNLEFSFDGKEWTALESASNATVTVKFATAIAEDGTYTSCDAKDALWAGIYYGEDNIIWMPTYKNFNELVAKVEAIDNSVDALIAIVEENAVITDITPSENGIGFTATAVKYELNYDVKGNLVKGTDGKYYKVTETTEITYADTAVSIEQDPETKKWYWVVNGAKTELMGTGFVPQVHTADGYVYVSIAADATTDNLEKGWVKIAQTDNNTVVTYNGTAETGYTIDFGGDQDSITVPSIEMFNAVLERVSALEESVGTINTLLTGFNQFVKSVEEIKSEGQLVGFKVVTAKYENLAWSEITSYYYDNQLVTPVKDGDAWFWYIYTVTKADDGTFSYGDPLKIPFDGTFVPKIKYEAGAIYVSTPTSKDDDLSTWTKLGNFADVQLGGTSQPTLNVTQDDTSVTFTFGSNNIQVAKYFQTPVITFTGTDGTTFDYTAAEKNEYGYATVYFTIVGSFVDTPNVKAACEGNWISGDVTCKLSDDKPETEATGSAKVKPTTAYVGDERKGKLSLYVPYYGATGIGQIDLTAAGSTNIGLSSTDRGMQILEKSAEETEATVTFSLDEGGNAPSSSGPCKLAFDFDYTLTNEITENGVRVETGNGFSNTYKANGWLGAGACTYDASTKTYTQKIDLTYNMDTEKSRTAAVIVYSPSGREVTRFVIEQDKLKPQNPDVPVIDNIPITKLVPSGKDAANCYIITGPGRYELPAYKGAYKANQLTDDKKCEGRPIVVWNDNSGNTIEFFQKDLADNKILIDINPTKTNGKVTGHSGAVSNGNAVVAVKGDDGKILWSWHLWFCATVPGDQDYGSGLFLMDRSLGAKESANLDLSLSGGNGTTLFWKDGLYYQWGRKDPLNPNITSGDYRYKSEMSGNLTASIQNPNSLYTNWNSTDGWDASKKLHDPCPQGYKVPSVDVWTKVKATSTTDVGNITRLNANEFAFVYALADPTIVYPYMGYLAADGSKQTGTIGEGVSEQKQYSLASNTKVNNPSNQSLQFSKPSTNPIQYDKIYYRLFDITVSGVYWANSTTSQNANSLEYGYKDKGIQIISYQKSTGVWKATGSFVKRYSADYSSASVENITIPPDVTDIEGMIGSSDYTALINAIKADIALSGANFSNIFEKIGTAFTKEPIYDKKQNSPAYGYTVRCIKINE